MIRAEGVSMVYRRGGEQVTALQSVDLSIAPGEFVVLTGPSGSGKSTLLSILGGLARATEGEVFVDGRDFVASSERALTRARREILGYVFQDFRLIGHLNALANVRLPLLFSRKEGRRDRAVELLERFNLTHRMRHRPEALSRGEMQRVALARALIHEPKILLADEPTANLDQANARTFWQYLRELNEENGLTILVATHSQDDLDPGRRHVRLSADGRLE